MNRAKNSTPASTYLMLVLLAVTVLAAAPRPLVAQITEKTFAIFPSPSVASCAGDSPTVTVQVIRGPLTDTLTVVGDHFLPHLNFDLFTVQRSNLLSDGKANPAFKNFGMAWYQSDVHSDVNGHISASIHTIVFDQIFGFDPDVKLGPTNTFHVGLWFDDPQDAVACGFDADKPTQFNGKHKAGPVAMISVPDSTTTLGPLCTNPNGTGGCNP